MKRLEVWGTVLQVIVGIVAVVLAWSIFSRFAVGSRAEETSYLWAGAVFVAVIVGIVVVSLLFSWLQRAQQSGQRTFSRGREEPQELHPTNTSQ